MTIKHAKLMSEYLEAAGWLVFSETPKDLQSTKKHIYKQWVLAYCSKYYLGMGSDIETAAKDFKLAYNYAKKELGS